MNLLAGLGLVSPFRGVFDPRSKKQLQQFLKRFAVDPPACRRTTRENIGVAVYAARPDLRAVFPLGLTPHQREAYATWLFENGRPDLGLTDDEIISYLQTAANNRSHGLRETWLLSPEWQRQFPDAFLRVGWENYKATIAKQYGITAHWLRRAKRPLTNKNSSSFGVNILAHFRYPSGLQEEALQYAAAIRAHGGKTPLRDAPFGFSRHESKDELLGEERFDVTLAKLGACESLDDAYVRAGWHPRPGVYRIACWSWELEHLPRSVAGKADLADEIWTPSEFCANAVRRTFPEKTVTAMLPAVSLPLFQPRPRARFQLPDDQFLFLFVFDIGSVMERKNPLGLIAAFRKAFRCEERVHLAIKVTRGESRPQEFAKLNRTARDAGVTLIDRVMPRNEVAALMNCCDAYVSLHRAEGFGYTMAEAILLGKPVIATGYSANLEFMTDQNAYLVKHRLVPVGNGHLPYPADAHWAEPELDHAATLIRHVYEHRVEAAELGRRAQASLPALISPESAGRRIMDRLGQIRTARSQ